MLSLSEISLRVLCYGCLILFVLVDGLRHSLSLKSLLLTVPHIIASFALTRSIILAHQSQCRLHTSLFLIGLLMFSALA